MRSELLISGGPPSLGQVLRIADDTEKRMELIWSRLAPNRGRVPHSDEAAPDEGCPAHKDAGVGSFNDTYQGAESSEARCMSRAGEYHAYCGSSQPVRTRFYNGATMVKEETAR